MTSAAPSFPSFLFENKVNTTERGAKGYIDYQYHQQFCVRSEYKELEVKYLKAQETIEQLQKELKSIKTAQGRFLNIG